MKSILQWTVIESWRKEINSHFKAIVKAAILSLEFPTIKAFKYWKNGRQMITISRIDSRKKFKHVKTSSDLRHRLRHRIHEIVSTTSYDNQPCFCAFRPEFVKAPFHDSQWLSVSDCLVAFSALFLSNLLSST